MSENEPESVVRKIEVNRTVISRRGILKGAGAMSLAASIDLWLPVPARARWKPASAENLRRFNGISPSLIKVAENYSNPNLLGPRMSDDLMGLINHMYSEEEAEVLQYLTPWSSKTARKLARQSHMTEAEVQSILDGIVNFQNSLLVFGKEDSEKKYNIIPILPGTFEFVLIKPDKSQLTEWHREFSLRLSDMYNSGAFAIYWDHPQELVRYIPAYPTIRDNPSALPSDKLEAILDRYDDIGVGLCQCTTVAKYNGSYCGRPQLTCMVMGTEAKRALAAGIVKRIDRKAALEIKHGAEQAGLSTWMMNMDDERFKMNISCSCCGCCCMALRTLNQFNMPGFVARPHFMPNIDLEKCINCGTCADRCNTEAHLVTEDSHTHDPVRCIGCGLCVNACPEGALSMEPVEKYEPPYKSITQIVVKKGPGFLASIRKEKKKRASEIA